jgi:hypothetical protein
MFGKREATKAKSTIKTDVAADIINVKLGDNVLTLDKNGCWTLGDYNFSRITFFLTLSGWQFNHYKFTRCLHPERVKVVK